MQKSVYSIVLSDDVVAQIEMTAAYSNTHHMVSTAADYEEPWTITYTNGGSDQAADEIILGAGVFAVDGTSVKVAQPDHCKTDCPACARICPQNAIIFPKSEEPRLNGSLSEPVTPSPMDRDAFRERLKHRKLRLFKEDD